MRNFDEERAERFARDRSFQIGGQTFTFRIGLRPEDYTEKTREYNEMLRGMAENKITGTQAIPVYDRTIEAFLDTDNDRQRWQELRQRESEPVTSYDLGQIILHIIEQQLGRPTEAPSSTGNGRRPSSASSTESSSSEVAARVVSEA